MRTLPYRADIARNMETEKSSCIKCIINLFPIFRGISLEKFQIVIVCFFSLGESAVHSHCIALFSARTIFRTSDYRRERNGFDFSHFDIAVRDRYLAVNGVYGCINHDFHCFFLSSWIFRECVLMCV